MSPEQHKELIQEVTNTVRVVVNGKIDAINNKLDTHMARAQEHWEVSQTFMKELQPVREGLFTLTSLNKFLKWIGLPLVGVFIYEWLIK
jgi:hypothetical protein